MERRFENRPSQISFTSDFHELLEGDLRPGAALTLRYDPARLSPPDAYVFGDPRWPVTAHLRYAEAGAVLMVPLLGRLTPTPDRDPTGQGSMLAGTATVPDDADFVEIWVGAQMPDGELWDSDFGINYWFRFPYLDIQDITAEVGADRNEARFSLALTAAAVVDDVRIRFSDTSTRVIVRREESLRREGGEGPRIRWRFENVVATAAVIRFKLYYWIANRRFKDDNSGQYYVADRPEFREKVPPPPSALFEATRAWSAKINLSRGSGS